MFHVFKINPVYIRNNVFLLCLFSDKAYAADDATNAVTVVFHPAAAA